MSNKLTVILGSLVLYALSSVFIYSSERSQADFYFPYQYELNVVGIGWLFSDSSINYLYFSIGNFLLVVSIILFVAFLVMFSRGFFVGVKDGK